MKMTLFFLLAAVLHFSLSASNISLLSDDSVSGTIPGLRILSWNIGMLPVIDLFSDKDDRAEAIASVLKSSDYDIIVFQEAFSSAGRSILRHILHEKYPYTYGPVNRSFLSLKCNSGIWIISRMPLSVKKEIEFTSSAGFDGFARKGAILLEGRFMSIPFQLLATHLQDDSYPQYIREQQLNEMYDKLILPFSDPGIPQIICGDFNTNNKVSEYYNGMLDRLNAEDGEISGKVKITFDDESNDAYRSAHPDPRQIDYILVRNSYFINRIIRKISVLKSSWGKGKEYLSDHNGVEASIELRKLDYYSRAVK